MTKEIVGLIFTGLAFLMILLPIIWGIIRGKRQSAFRLIWVVATGALSLFLAILLANLLLAVVKIGGQSLQDFALTQVANRSESLRQIMADNPEMMAKVSGLVAEGIAAVLRIVLFILLFWLLKWLLYPVWLVLARKYYPNKALSGQNIKMEDGTVVPKVVQKPQQKGRLLGAVYGLCMGLFVMILTFIPFSTLNNVVVAVDRETQVQNGETTEPGIISQMLGKYSGLVYSYNDSIIGKVLITTKVDAVQSFIGNQLTTIKVAGKKSSIANEIHEFAPLYNDAKKLMTYAHDLNAITKEDIEEIIPIAKKLATKALSSELISGLYDEFRDYVVDAMLDTEKDFIIKLPTFENAEINTTFRNCFAQVKNISFDDIKNDIDKAFAFATELNEDTTLIVDFLHRESITVQKIRDQVSVALTNSISEKLSNIKLVEKCFPIAFNPLAKYVVQKLPAIEYNSEEVTIVWTDVENVTSEMLKNDLSSMLSDLVLTIKGATTDPSEFEVEDRFEFEFNGETYYINYNVFANIGGVLDTVKSAELLHPDTYQSVMTYGQTFAKKEIDKVLDEDSADLKLAIHRMIETLSNEENFKTEFTYIGNAAKVYLAAETKEIETYMAVLDELMPTYIYSHNIAAEKNANEDRDYVYAHLNLYLKQLVNEKFEDVFVVTDEEVDDITENISKIESFVTEYGIVDDLINFVDTNTFEIFTTAILTELGGYLDDIVATSKIIDDSLCKVLLKSLINKLNVPTELADVMVGDLTIKQKLIANVNDIESYEFELGKVGILLNTDYGSMTTLAEFGAVMDSVAGSKLFNGMANAIVMSELDGRESDFEEYATVFNDIKTNLEKLETYETEFGYLDEFIDFAKSSTITIQDIKDFFNDNLLNEDGRSKSILLDDKTIFDIVCAGVDDIEFGDVSITAFGNLKQNIKAQILADYEAEEKIIDVLDEIDDMQAYYTANLKDSIAIDSTTSKQDLIDFGTLLNNLADFDKILNEDAVNDIGNYAISKINEGIQDSTEPGITAQVKQDVQDIVDAIDWTSPVDFEQVLSDIADALNLA